jgi:soluble lytic murein transglycosylase-like protein
LLTALLPLQAETAAQQRARVAAAMQPSIARQLAAVELQRRTVRSFLIQPTAPSCDPIPKEQVDPIIEEAAKEEGLQADLLRAVIGQESAFRPCAVSPKGAMGLMQLMPDTAARFGVRDPFEPRQNVSSGAKFLKELLARYGGDVSLALGAYNAGPAAVDASGGVPFIRETLQYVNEILGKLPN